MLTFQPPVMSGYKQKQYSVIRFCEFLSGVIALYTNVVLPKTNLA